MQELAGRVAVVTGGASGIGAGMARAFADAGMRVGIADIEAAAAEKAAIALRERGAEALAVETDVASRDSVEALAERIFAELGGVHVICNNAGVCLDVPLAQASDADWRWLLSVNLEGVVHGIQAFVPRLLAQGEGGHVVNTASMGALLAGPQLGIYVTTKFAVLGLTESLRQELAPRGIGVSALCPGFVRTRLVDAQRNRPAALDGSPPGLDWLVPGVEAGMDPLHVGACVVRGVRENQPWIFTHGGALREVVGARFQSILDALAAVPEA